VASTPAGEAIAHVLATFADEAGALGYLVVRLDASRSAPLA